MGNTHCYVCDPAEAGEQDGEVKTFQHLRKLPRFPSSYATPIPHLQRSNRFGGPFTQGAALGYPISALWASRHCFLALGTCHTALGPVFPWHRATGCRLHSFPPSPGRCPGLSYFRPSAFFPRYSLLFSSFLPPGGYYFSPPL